MLGDSSSLQIDVTLNTLFVPKSYYVLLFINLSDLLGNVMCV